MGEQSQDCDLEDVIVEAGAVGELEAAVEKAKALRGVLASGLPPKV